MTVDKVELRRLAEECVKHGDNWYDSGNIEAFPEFLEDRDFVIAANPSTVLALLDDFQKAEAERDSALAELEAYRKDAERYRWLSAHQSSEYPEYIVLREYIEDAAAQGCFRTDYYRSKNELDSAVDAAMAHAKENGND